MTGVPLDEVSAQDFMVVRAALVRRVGGANEALVWSRVHWRCAPTSGASYQHDDSGAWWWAASYGVIADETGLTPKQVRTAADRLVTAGFMLSEKHHLRSSYDQTVSYRTLVTSDVPARAGGVEKGKSDVPHRADVSSIEDSKNSLFDGLDVPPVEVVDRFDEFWSVWPRRQEKKAAREAWAKAVTRVSQDTIVSAARSYAAVHTDPKYVPAPHRWLNHDRWDDELVSAGPAGAASMDEFPGEEWMAFR